ncbi:hypothetical protein [Streptomyces tagetis]|nr:hypothetical protein [Streptomyces sp. RG38]
MRRRAESTTGPFGHDEAPAMPRRSPGAGATRVPLQAAGAGEDGR